MNLFRLQNLETSGKVQARSKNTSDTALGTCTCWSSIPALRAIPVLANLNGRCGLFQLCLEALLYIPNQRRISKQTLSPNAHTSLMSPRPALCKYHRISTPDWAFVSSAEPTCGSSTSLNLNPPAVWTTKKCLDRPTSDVSESIFILCRSLVSN